jgi:hypothetical protein
MHSALIAADVSAFRCCCTAVSKFLTNEEARDVRQTLVLAIVRVVMLFSASDVSCMADFECVSIKAVCVRRSEWARLDGEIF